MSKDFEKQRKELKKHGLIALCIMDSNGGLRVEFKNVSDYGDVSDNICRCEMHKGSLLFLDVPAESFNWQQQNFISKEISRQLADLDK